MTPGHTPTETGRRHELPHRSGGAREFKRCRRQWNFASPHRLDLEPIQSADAGLFAALKDALAVYYYPGTWDWQHGLKQSLVHKSLERSLSDATDTLHAARELLDCYDAWANTSTTSHRSRSTMTCSAWSPIRATPSVRC